MPATFKVIRHVRPKRHCARCATLVQAPAASRPVTRGLAGAGLLAQVLVAKYADHLPLYRQSAIYAREGVALSRSTLADWVGSATVLLAPLGGAGTGRLDTGGWLTLTRQGLQPAARPGLSELLRRQHAEREPSEDEITGQPFRSLNAALYERAEPNFLGV